LFSRKTPWKCSPKDGKTSHQPAGKSLTERQRNKRGEKKSTALTWKKENDFLRGGSGSAGIFCEKKDPHCKLVGPAVIIILKPPPHVCDGSVFQV
jgi:hypothetical protein